MFALVNDVEAYPEFLHWCSGARVLKREDNVVHAEVEVRFAGLHQKFSTRNTLERPSRIVISLLNGPFRRLDGDWTFADRRQGGCNIELSLDFSVSLTPLGFLLSRVFEEIARSQMDAFIRRARHVYG